MGYASGHASFASDEPDGAFWLYTRDDRVVNACSTSALSVVLDARAALGLAPLAAWDTALLGAMRSRAIELSGPTMAWARLADALAREGDRVSRLAVVLAIYFAYYEPNGMRLDAIALPDAADLPRLGATIGGEPEPIVCWDPARDPDPSRADADRGAAVAETQFGVRVHAGESPPAHGGPLGSPYRGPSDAGVWIGIAVAAAVAFILFGSAGRGR